MSDRGSVDKRERNRSYDDMIDMLDARKKELESNIHPNQDLTIFKQLCPKEKYQTGGVCAISKSSSKLETCAFCGKLVNKDYLTRKRKDPQDHKKMHSICDRCNQAYLDRQMLTPFWKNSYKLKVMADQREADFNGLELVMQDINSDIISKRKSVRS